MAVGVLSLLIINFTRVITTLQQWDFLSTLPLSAPPAYLFASGLIWSLLSLAVMWGLLAAKAWVLKSMKAYSILYGLYYWLEQWLVKSNPLRMTNWPFIMIVTLLCISLVFWISSREAVKTYFGVINE